MINPETASCYADVSIVRLLHSPNGETRIVTTFLAISQLKLREMDLTIEKGSITMEAVMFVWQ